ncbi:MAG: hypothetical protein IZT56_15410 [Bacteroidetes bacterium]|nr:hypothetical protein [Bacteroidota bacterium]
MNEQTTIELINKQFKTNLILVDYQFCDFDAEDENYIVEVKNRKEFYQDKLIECVKLFKNYQNSQIKNKDFLYIVTDLKGVYVFNISKNIDEITSTKMYKTLQPESTEFNSTKQINKFVYFLDTKLSKQIK